MSGTEKPRQMTREEILKAMETEPPGGYFVWDGVDEDERPVTQEEWDASRAGDSLLAVASPIHLV